MHVTLQTAEEEYRYNLDKGCRIRIVRMELAIEKEPPEKRHRIDKEICNRRK